MFEVKGVKDGEYLEYLGRPLVRQGDDIYYGDLSDKYCVHMVVISDKPSEVKADITVPDKIMIQLLKCEDGTNEKAIEKNGMCNGLTDALETAAAWLSNRSA